MKQSIKSIKQIFTQAPPMSTHAQTDKSSVFSPHASCSQLMNTFIHQNGRVEWQTERDNTKNRQLCWNFCPTSNSCRTAQHFHNFHTDTHPECQCSNVIHTHMYMYNTYHRPISYLSRTFAPRHQTMSRPGPSRNLHINDEFSRTNYRDWHHTNSPILTVIAGTIRPTTPTASHGTVLFLYGNLMESSSQKKPRWNGRKCPNSNMIVGMSTEKSNANSKCSSSKIHSETFGDENKNLY